MPLPPVPPGAAAAGLAGLADGDAKTATSAVAAEGDIGCDGRATVFRNESAAQVQAAARPATAGATVACPADVSAVTASPAAGTCTTRTAADRAGSAVAAGTAGRATAARAGATACATRPADRPIGRDGTALIQRRPFHRRKCRCHRHGPTPGGGVAGIAASVTVAAGLAGLALRRIPGPGALAAAPAGAAIAPGAPRRPCWLR